MYDLTNSISPDLRRELEGRIEEVRREIERFRDIFDLPRGEISVARSIWGEMPINWEMLEESRSRRLRGYGEIPAGLPAILDPMIDRLTTLAAGIEKLLEPGPRPKRSR